MIATIGEALDQGWTITVRCAWGKREAMKWNGKSVVERATSTTRPPPRARAAPGTWLSSIPKAR